MHWNCPTKGALGHPLLNKAHACACTRAHIHFHARAHLLDTFVPRQVSLDCSQAGKPPHHPGCSSTQAPGQVGLCSWWNTRFMPAPVRTSA